MRDGDVFGYDILESVMKGDEMKRHFGVKARDEDMVSGDMVALSILFFVLASVLVICFIII